DLRTIQMDIATENPDGTFYASSGNIYVYSEADNSVNTFGGWSVYLEKANPKTASYVIPETQVLQAGNYIAVSLETDNGKDAGVAAANFIIDNIAFLDADGNTIAADTSAVYVAPVTEDIWAGLTPIANETEIEGFAVSGDGWAQNGVNTTLNGGTFDATTLTPGSILTIYYNSESEIDKDMWLVGVSTEDNPNGTWLRICDKDGALRAA
ncbi:MAG: hypothetical protein HGA25_01290, partial [Clostridiales bacterium]|nr:hypothetical protein [Clostridiales bacterium]